MTSPSQRTPYLISHHLETSQPLQTCITTNHCCGPAAHILMVVCSTSPPSTTAEPSAHHRGTSAELRLLQAHVTAAGPQAHVPQRSFCTAYIFTYLLKPDRLCLQTEGGNSNMREGLLLWRGRTRYFSEVLQFSLPRSALQHAGDLQPSLLGVGDAAILALFKQQPLN